jgi:glycosyltransferase involved in cell wall biosynthesis
LVGAKPTKSDNQNPGGQLTASVGLTNYLRLKGYTVDIVDTTQSSFPVPSLIVRLNKGFRRFVELFRLLQSNRINGVIIFASAGFSFYERICMSLLCRYFEVPDLFFIRSGHFMAKVKASYSSALFAKLLLKVPFRIGAQGNKWFEFYGMLGVDPSKTTVIRNWLPDSIVIRDSPKVWKVDEPINFIYVGWLVHEKGVIELLDAISELRSHYQFRFTFVGSGTLDAHVRQFIIDSGWDPDVVALGWKKPEEVQQLLIAADVFVLPSYAEGFPNALLEAMAKGLPAICSDVGGISDSLAHNVNGFLIPPRQHKPLVEAMEQYLLHPDLIEKHSQATLSILRSNHGLELNCQKIISALDECINK